MIEIMLSKNLWMNGAEQLRGLVSSITVFFFISLSSPYFSVNIWKSRLCHSEMCYRGKECEEEW